LSAVTLTRSDKRITIDDVAREADVSPASVSRVISGKGYVSDDVRRRVTEALVRTGYVVNRQARGLAGGRSQVVGLVVRDLDTSYIGEVIRGIDEELASAQYDLMLYTTHRRKHRESAFVATITSGFADGLLLVLPTDPEAYIDSIARRGFPYVLIDHGGLNDPGPSVGATNEQGGYDATRYLLDLGHTRIGLITGFLQMGCATDRIAGYRRAHAERGIPVDESLIGDFHQPLGYERARELLALDEPPTAIFASNDESAFGVMEAVRDCGLRIGTDVSIVGFDDILTSSMVHPPLTTVRQPLKEMGRRATQMLLARIENPSLPPERVDLPTELVIRQSCSGRAGP
jgi:LacI family transcriptional regulator